jgi:hypothetical protein
VQKSALATRRSGKSERRFSLTFPKGRDCLVLAGKPPDSTNAGRRMNHFGPHWTVTNAKGNAFRILGKSKISLSISQSQYSFTP